MTQAQGLFSEELPLDLLKLLVGMLHPRERVQLRLLNRYMAHNVPWEERMREKAGRLIRSVGNAGPHAEQLRRCDSVALFFELARRVGRLRVANLRWLPIEAVDPEEWVGGKVPAHTPVPCILCEADLRLHAKIRGDPDQDDLSLGGCKACGAAI